MSTRAEEPTLKDPREFMNQPAPHWPTKICGENTCWHERVAPSLLCAEHELMFWGRYGTTSLGRLRKHGDVWDSEIGGDKPEISIS